MIDPDLASDTRRGAEEVDGWLRVAYGLRSEKAIVVGVRSIYEGRGKLHLFYVMYAAMVDNSLISVQQLKGHDSCAVNILPTVAYITSVQHHPTPDTIEYDHNRMPHRHVRPPLPLRQFLT